MNDLKQAKRIIEDYRSSQNPYLDLEGSGITDLGDFFIISL